MLSLAANTIALGREKDQSMVPLLVGFVCDLVSEVPNFLGLFPQST